MKRRGFTLLEVLISILVLILCIMGILPLITVAMRSQKRALDNATANTIARQVLSEVQEVLDNPKPRDLRDRPIPGFPDTFKYDATFVPVTPPDPAESTFVVRVTVKWEYERVVQSWDFQSVMMRKLDHTDLPAGPGGPAGPSTPTTAPPKPKPEPNVDFSRKGLDVVSNSRYLPPEGVRVVEAAVEASETRARSSIGGWDTKHSQKGSRGVSIFFIQPMNGEKTEDGQFIYAVNLAAVWFPFEESGVTSPRAIHTVRREVYVDGKRSQNNSHETRLEDPRSADDPFFARQKQIDRGPEGAGSKLGAKGVMAWDSPGITGPWAEVQNYEVRIRWTGVTWIIGKTEKAPHQPAGYFRWSVVLEGRVGSGPADTKLVARLEAVAFVETAEGDEILRKYLPK